MMRHTPLAPSPVDRQAACAPLPTFSICCGEPFVARAVANSLVAAGFQSDPTATIVVVLDAPRGFAMEVLRRSPRCNQRVIAVTWSPCPEYWADLDDLGAQILIAGDQPDYPLPIALTHAAYGAQIRVVPDRTTPLTLTERQILRLLACGGSNQQIAEQLGMRHQSIRNQLTTIYRKLGLADRSAAILYYWGIWPAVTQSPAWIAPPAEETVM